MTAPWINPDEAALRARLGARAVAAPSLLERLFQLLIADARWRISFDDFTGLMDRIPDLRLPFECLMHTCDFCTLAKSRRHSFDDCARNKHAVNRLLLYRGRGVAGPCHLGLTDIVEPLVAGGRVLGAFYCGSVVVAGSEEQSRRKVVRYCARRRLEPAPLLEALARVPVVSPREFEAMRQRVRSMGQVVAQLLEGWGCPVGTTKAGFKSYVWEGGRPIPLPLRHAMARLRMRYSEPVELRALAGELRVSADYVGRLFRRHLGVTFNEYLAQLRVDHARRLLEAGIPAGEVAYRTGFADQAHLCRTFKRLAGVTPAAFARAARQGHAPERS